MAGDNRFLTIRQARATRQAASEAFFKALDEWTRDGKNAERVMKLRHEWDDANDAYERARRRAAWTRAKRLLRLEAGGRPQYDMVCEFIRNDFKVVRE